MPASSCQAIASEPRNGDHVVQLYEDEHFLASAISPFLATGLTRWEGVIVVATPAHWKLFRQDLESRGVNVTSALDQQQLIVEDASTMLSDIMDDGTPDAARFDERVGGAVRQVAARYPRVRIYGEMVDLLWHANRIAAAVRLEELWNGLAKIHPFSLFCSYRMDGFDRVLYQGTLQDVCRTHSHAFPAEDCGRLERAVNRALGEILGASQAKTLRASFAVRQYSGTEMPDSQALLFWLREQMPTMADAVLIRARQYYREDSVVSLMA